MTAWKYKSAPTRWRTGLTEETSATQQQGLPLVFCDDGKWDWEKELKHPASTVYSTKYNYDAPLFGEGAIPLNRWVGMKYIVYNIDNNTHVKLETYIDTVSDVTNGAPANGGHWELVGSTVDSGSNRPGADISGCPDLTQDMAVTVGHGTILLRTDGEACTWKFFGPRDRSEFRGPDISAAAADKSECDAFVNNRPQSRPVARQSRVACVVR